MVLMDRDLFPVVVKGLIVRDRKLLIGKKKEQDGHPISGQWHLLGGHVEHGESLDGAIRREVKEETGLTVEVAGLVEASTFAWEKDDECNAVQFVFHCEAGSGEASAGEDLVAVKWVQPENLVDALGPVEADRVEASDTQLQFISRLS